jgi:hypothetical protein
VWNTLGVGKKWCDEVLDIDWKESMLWDDEVSMLEHTGCKVSSVGGRVVYILDHCPRLPSSHHADQKGIDVGTEEGHGSTSVKCSSGDVAFFQA